MKISKEKLEQIIKEETEKIVQKKSTDETMYKTDSGIEVAMDDKLQSLIKGLYGKLGSKFLEKILDEMLRSWEPAQMKSFLSSIAKKHQVSAGGIEYREGLNTPNEEPYFASDLQNLLRSEFQIQNLDSKSPQEANFISKI